MCSRLADVSRRIAERSVALCLRGATIARGIPSFVRALQSYLFHRAIVTILTRTGSDVNRRYALIALYAALSAVVIPALTFVYLSGPLMLLAVSTLAVFAATANTVTLPVYLFGAGLVFTTAPIWIPVWYGAAGGILCLCAFVTIWACAGAVALSGGHTFAAINWLLCRIHLIITTAFRYCFGDAINSSAAPVPCVIAAPPEAAAHSDRQRMAGDVKDEPSSASTPQRPRRRSPAPPSPDKPTGGNGWAPSLSPLRESTRTRTIQPIALTTSAAAATNTTEPATPTNGSGDGGVLQSLLRGVTRVALWLISLPIRAARAIAVAWTRVVEWPQWAEWECDPLRMRVPYTYIQDMKLEVHQSERRLGWRTDAPRAADYPDIALYLN